MKGGIGIGDRAVGAEDELGVRRRFEGLAEEIEATEQRALGAVRGKCRHAAQRRQDDERRRHRPGHRPVDDVGKAE